MKLLKDISIPVDVSLCVPNLKARHAVKEEQGLVLKCPPSVVKHYSLEKFCAPESCENSRLTIGNGNCCIQAFQFGVLGVETRFTKSLTLSIRLDESRRLLLELFHLILR